MEKKKIKIHNYSFKSIDVEELLKDFVLCTDKLGERKGSDGDKTKVRDSLKGGKGVRWVAGIESGRPHKSLAPSHTE